MGLRLTTGNIGTRYGNGMKVEVYDELYSASAISIDVDDKGAIITYQPEDEDMQFCILSSKAEISFFIEDSDIETFVNDINTAYETQMAVVVYYGGSVHWVGHVLPDLVTYEDKPLLIKPKFKLVATDSLKRMKRVAYKDTSGPYTGVDSIKDHFIKLIGHIGLNTYLEIDNLAVIEFGLNWVAKDQTSGDPAALIKFDHRALYQIDDKGNYRYPSVYDVICTLCRQFKLRWFMGGFGRYRVYQTVEMGSGSLTTYSYKGDGTAYSGPNTTNLLRTADANWTGKYSGGMYGFFPPLNIVQVNYIHFGYINLAQGLTWDETTQPTVPVPPSTYSVDANTVFTFKADLHYSVFSSAARPWFLYFHFMFNVDTDYLERRAITTLGVPSLYDPEITTDSTDRWVEIVDLNVNPNSPHFNSGYVPIEFTTPPFTAEGDFTFTLDYEATYGQFAIIDASAITITWTITNVELNPIPEDGDVSQWSNTKTLTAFNATTGNSTKEVYNTPIGQSLGFGKLLVEDASGVNIDGIDWGVGATASGQSIEELLAIETIKSQSVPIRKIGATMDVHGVSYTEGALGIGNVILHGSNYWVPHDAKWIIGKDVMDGTWYLSDTSGTTSGNTTAETVIEFIDPDGNEVLTVFPTGLGGGEPNPNAGSSGVPGTPGVVNVIDVLFPRTTNDIDEGDTVTQIPIESRTVDGEYKVGQTVTLVNPQTGGQQDFTITAESQISDTFLSVTSDTADFDFPTGSWIVKSQETVAVTGGGSSSMYRQEFAAHASATITVTENGGTLPTNSAAITIYYDNGQIISDTYWSHVAATGVITLTFTPPGQQSIWVDFTI